MILLRIFKNDRGGGVAAVFLVALGLFVGAFVRQPDLTAFTGMPFYNLIFGSIHLHPILNRLLALAFLLVLSNMLARIGVRFVLLEHRSFMPALFFLLFSAVLPGSQQVSPALVGSVSYLLSFAILFDLNEDPPDTFRIFFSGVVLALGSMFSLRLIWFIPLMWLSLATLRPVTWRELAYPVIAYLILFLFLFTWYWAIRDDGKQMVELLRENLSFGEPIRARQNSVYFYYGYSLFLVFIASIHMARRFQTRKTVVQNIYQVLFYLFVAGMLFFMFILRFSPSGLVFIGFPLAYILSDFFHRRKNHWTHELLLWILVGGVVYVQWMVYHGR